MTKHGGDEESRIHLRGMIGSQTLLARLSRFHGYHPEPATLIQSKNSHKPITVSISDECFAQFTAPVKARLGNNVSLQITGRELLRIVANFYEITVNEMRSPRREKHDVRARFAFYYIANKHMMLSASEIGRLVCKDHSTVLQGMKSIQRWLTKDERFADEIELIGLKINEQFGVTSEAAA